MGWKRETQGGRAGGRKPSAAFFQDGNHIRSTAADKPDLGSVLPKAVGSIAGAVSVSGKTAFNFSHYLSMYPFFEFVDCKENPSTLDYESV